jgi:hypothetical protein
VIRDVSGPTSALLANRALLTMPPVYVAGKKPGEAAGGSNGRTGPLQALAPAERTAATTTSDLLIPRTRGSLAPVQSRARPIRQVPGGGLGDT